MRRVVDTLMDWLTRPRVRRVRRWSFVVTVPLAVLFAQLWGLQQVGALVVLRVLAWAAVAAAAWRMGGERGEALRDLLVHPRVRAFTRAELDVMATLPRLALQRRTVAGGGYHRGTFGIAVAGAFTPMVAAEGLVVHLLVGHGWLAWASTAVHLYALAWLWGVALGPVAYPHRVVGDRLVLRSGPLYRVVVPRGLVTRVETRTERIGGEGSLHERDGAVLLSARGRVDVWLDLAEPVLVQRPLQDPLAARRLAVASDDPAALVASICRPPPPPESGVAGSALAALLGGAAVVHEATQPG